MQQMQAVSVIPGRAASARLEDQPMPSPRANEVLVRVLATGVCGTDRELLAGHTGTPPPGEERLIIGHECLGVVERPDASGVLNAGTLVTPIVRRPDGCPPCRLGRWDLCVWGRYTEHGIHGAHGFMTGWFAERPEYLVPVPHELRAIGVLVEPAAVVAKAVAEAAALRARIPWPASRALVLGAGTIGLLATLLLRRQGVEVSALDLAPAGSRKARLVEGCGASYIDSRATTVADVAAHGGTVDLVIEATGVPAMSLAAMEAAGAGGVAMLLGVSGTEALMQVDAAQLNRRLVERNAVVAGSINAARMHFDAAVAGLTDVARRWPGLLDQMVTGRHPLARWEDALTGGPDTIKAVVEP